MAEIRVAAENRKARHNYFVDETLEAGIVLAGTEVKSLRAGRADIGESYASEQGGEIYLLNAYIPEYAAGNRFNHEPRRPRKLLLHRREVVRLKDQVGREGGTVVPLKLYFNERGIAKVLLGFVRGKRQHDKRQAVKERDWNRQKQRLLRDRG
jgi:SsrA-binding protein